MVPHPLTGFHYPYSDMGLTGRLPDTRRLRRRRTTRPRHLPTIQRHMVHIRFHLGHLLTTLRSHRRHPDPELVRLLRETNSGLTRISTDKTLVLVRVCLCESIKSYFPLRAQGERDAHRSSQRLQSWRLRSFAWLGTSWRGLFVLRLIECII
jgi:hypothetical protein